MSETITVNLVVVNGVLDQAASIVAAESAIVRRAAEMNEEGSRIGDAVAELFAESKGASIALPVVASLVCNRLNVPHQAFSTVSERVMEFVRANAQGTVDKATKAEQRPDSTYLIVKGANGGVCVRADRTVKAAQ